jgi:hypothetical protein
MARIECIRNFVTVFEVRVPGVYEAGSQLIHFELQELVR